jgi:acyl phosphate:glycerol-3-phosphate acyltransferase
LNLTLVTYCIIAYIVGSIPIGKIVASFQGVDIQKAGTGNIGASNTYLVLGKRAGALVLLGDLGKSFIMMEIAIYSLAIHNALIVGFFLLLGNMKSVFLRFTGGKGIATGLGIFLATEPIAAFVMLTFWGVATLYIKYIAYFSVAGTLLIPITYYKYDHDMLSLFLAALLSIMILIRHKSLVLVKNKGERPTL